MSNTLTPRIFSYFFFNLKMSNFDIEQYRECIEKLQNDEDKVAALNDIKNLLAYKSAREVINSLRNIGIIQIVKCLNAQNNSLIELTCDVLKECFEKFEPGEVIRNYTSIFMYLLRHENSCVRKLAVDEVYKAVTGDLSLLPVPQYIDVFVSIAQLICDSDLGIANKSILITSNLSFEAYPKILEELQFFLENGNNNSKCNIYELVICISAKSYELLKLCADSGYINHIVAELQSNDILYQLNILELLSRLAIKSHGIGYLVKHGTLDDISKIILDLKDNPLKGLLIPGYMRFFGSIAHHYPKEMFDKYPDLSYFPFEVLEGGDQTVLPVALDTLGFIGTTIEGKLCLAALGSTYLKGVEKVCQLIKNSATEIKVRALYCFANLISIEKDPILSKTCPVDHRITLMTREWFRSLNTQPGPMETLFEICKNPFPDIRLAAFTLLDAVCQHQWGEELVARTAGLIEYLLDRSVNYTKDSKEAKYDIIKRLSNSAAFDASIITRLQNYAEQGPFYSETALQVAMEEGD